MLQVNVNTNRGYSAEKANMFTQPKIRINWPQMNG